MPPGPDEPASVEPASISPTDPQAALTCKHGPARYAYAITPLIDLDTDGILEVEATPLHFAAEVAAPRTLVSRIETKLRIAPASLSTDKAYGSGPLLGSLVDRNITPYIPVIATRLKQPFFNILRCFSTRQVSGFGLWLRNGEHAHCCSAAVVPGNDWFWCERTFTVVHRNGVSWS